jgi:RNA polymerase sigma-70 factor (ECF subfamily)
MTIENFKEDILPLKHPIYRFAFFMLKNEDDAEDICQEVLIKIWEKRDRLLEIENLRAWAITITRNKCLDHIKARKGKQFSWDDGYDAPTNETPYQVLSISDETNWVKKIMEKLPLLQKEVFYLRHFEENSYKEICEALDLTESKVKVYLHRARNYIKNAMEEKHNYGLKTG